MEKLDNLGQPCVQTYWLVTYTFNWHPYLHVRRNHSRGVETSSTIEILSEKPLVVVYLRGMLIHDLLGILHSICTMESGHLRINLLFFGMFIRKELFDRALACSCLVYCKTRCKLDVRSNLYGIKHRNCKILAVVADHVVFWSLFSHVENHHLAWRGPNLRPEFQGDMDAY